MFQVKKCFWDCLKSMDDTQRDKDDIPLISEDKWLTYFCSLHSKYSINPGQQSIMNDLNLLEHHKEQLPSLDYLITENEIVVVAKTLQNNKSAFSGRIKTEMIKASLEEMMPSGIMPNT